MKTVEDQVLESACAAFMSACVAERDAQREIDRARNCELEARDKRVSRDANLIVARTAPLNAKTIQNYCAGKGVTEPPKPLLDALLSLYAEPR